MPKSPEHLGAIWEFLKSDEYVEEVRKIDRSLKVPTLTLLKVPFDLAQWQKVASQKYLNGLPEPYSDDPTQWLFHGHPARADKGTALHVALARLCGYRWPAETDATMRLSAEARDRVAKVAALPGRRDGSVPAFRRRRGTPTRRAAARLSCRRVRGRWSDALGRGGWSPRPMKCRQDMPPATAPGGLVARSAVSAALCSCSTSGRSVVDHRRARRRLHRRRALPPPRPCQSGTAGLRDARRLDHEARRRPARRGRAHPATEARTHPRRRAPYDIFVRWKPLDKQPLGWEPDLDDGVRLNIRPFVEAGVLAHVPNVKYSPQIAAMMSPPRRGTTVFNGKRRNDHHTTLAEKWAAREAAAGRFA